MELVDQPEDIGEEPLTLIDIDLTDIQPPEDDFPPQFPGLNMNEMWGRRLSIETLWLISNIRSTEEPLEDEPLEEMPDHSIPVGDDMEADDDEDDPEEEDDEESDALGEDLSLITERVHANSITI